MNRDELIMEIADILAIIDADTDKPLVAKEVRRPLAHKIISLLAPILADAEKATGVCEWTYTPDFYQTGCGKIITIPIWRFGKHPYCPCCGKKIEVKDGD